MWLPHVDAYVLPTCSIKDILYRCVRNKHTREVKLFANGYRPFNCFFFELAKSFGKLKCDNVNRL